MSIPLIVLGFAIVIAVMVDFLMTTISLRAEGPLTRIVSSVVATSLSWLGGPFKRYGGPITLSSVAAFWIVSQWFAWAAIFYGARRHLEGPDGFPAVGWLDSVGFAGSTLSTMGLGVLTPTHPWLHVAAVVSSVFGILVLTLSVTYVLNVSNVAVRSRSVALQLRDVTHVTAAAGSPMEAAHDLLDRADELGATLHALADQRDSFPLAQLYEVSGSPRDVGLRAERLNALVEPAAQAAIESLSRTKLQLLSNALERLTR